MTGREKKEVQRKEVGWERGYESKRKEKKWEGGGVEKGVGK